MEKHTPKKDLLSKRKNFFCAWKKEIKQNGSAYLMILPVILFYIIFHYAPMYGVLMAFQDYSPRLGIGGSDWIGLDNFVRFLTTDDFGRVFSNTVTISMATLIFSFPAPILLALLLNEVRNMKFRKIVQTVSYLPHFISMVVICGMIKTFVANDGLIGSIVSAVTGSNASMLMNENYFLPIYVISDIWQTVGWGSIVYLAALSAVDPNLYEAADIDGAGKFRKIINITLPSISTTIITMFILRIGKVMNIGYEKIILLYNPIIYDKSDVISSYVYRMGFENQNWSYSSAVGLFNSVINLILLLITNKLSKKMSDTGLF